MKELTREMIEEFNLEELGYDFMGYFPQNKDIYTFHHLKPKRYGGKLEWENGAILFSTPHQYIHIIEYYEQNLFEFITEEMKLMKLKGYVDIANLKRINIALEEFESIYDNFYNKKNKKLIKDEYKNRMLRRY